MHITGDSDLLPENSCLSIIESDHFNEHEYKLGMKFIYGVKNNSLN